MYKESLHHITLGVITVADKDYTLFTWKHQGVYSSAECDSHSPDSLMFLRKHCVSLSAMVITPSVMRCRLSLYNVIKNRWPSRFYCRSYQCFGAALLILVVLFQNEVGKERNSSGLNFKTNCQVQKIFGVPSYAQCHDPN